MLYGQVWQALLANEKGVIYTVKNGDVAQLGERLLRMQEVRGSIPLISTT